MKYVVELSREAQRFYASCDRPVARKLDKCFASLETNPRQGNNVKRLSGPFDGAWRYRVGDLRVIYIIDEGAVKVSVITITKRGDAYR